MGACLGLTESYPETEIIFASFPKVAGDIALISEHTSHNVKFHTIKGFSIAEAIAKSISGSYDTPLGDVFRSAPGLRGIERLTKIFRLVGFPWTVDEHWDMYEAARNIIKDVDPALVVVEPTMLPFMHALRALNWNRVLLSAHVLAVQVAQIDATATRPWRYPL